MQTNCNWQLSFTLTPLQKATSELFFCLCVENSLRVRPKIAYENVCRLQVHFHAIQSHFLWKVSGADTNRILRCLPLGWSESGSVIQDHSDHSASKEPMNPWPRFLWCTMIRLILDLWSWFWSPQRNAPLERRVQDMDHPRRSPVGKIQEHATSEKKSWAPRKLVFRHSEIKLSHYFYLTGVVRALQIPLDPP